MSRNIFTGIHGTYRPPPPWDGTPAPEGEDLALLAGHWRTHGDKDGSLEARIHEIIMRRAQFGIIKASSASPWTYEVAADAATNAMLALGSPSWKPELGTWKYVDMAILNYWRSQMKRKFRRFIPMVSIDLPESELQVEEPKRDYTLYVDPEKWDVLYSKLSKLEREILERYHGVHGEMRDLAAELRVDVRRIDNAVERIKRKARELGIMPPSDGRNKKSAKQAG